MQQPAVQEPSIARSSDVVRAPVVALFPSVRWPFVEIAAMSALLLSYIWLWSGAFEGAFSLCVVVYFGIGIAAHWRAGERPRDVGIRIDNFGRAARDAFLATLAIGLVLAGAGALLGGLDFPPPADWPVALRDGIIWGLMQQYGLLTIYYRRFATLLPGHRDEPLWAASAVFAVLHLPNPFLTLATLAAGAVSCWLYRRTPNVFVLGIMHGVVSFLIIHCLPVAITMGMRVGPGFFRFVSS